MQFKVPQFIDVEDKIFGPFTFKQFAYLAGGGGIIFIIYKLLPFWIAIILIIPVGILTGLLTFYKFNNKPFIFYLQAGMQYLLSNKLFIWKQRLVKPEIKKNEDKEEPSIIPAVSSSRLKDLSWSLDVQENNTDSDR